MKTAVSIPDPIFERAESLAHRTGKSRSQVYAEALERYLDVLDPEAVTAAMNAVCDALEEGEAIDPAFAAAAHRRLVETEW